MFRGDRHKTETAGGPDLWRTLAYDPEPLAVGARRHPKAEAAGLAPTSVRQADGTRRIQKWRLIGSEVSQNRKLINKKLAEFVFSQYNLML
ncbi:hypothetical protein DOE78_01945 [Bacillus sp. Y1]|nr:hypothetical protein DOE78_01945 [Bacillus sp. Y1]